MPTNKFWRTGGFSFLSISGILMQLFHRLRALQAASYHSRGTHTNLGPSFSEILPIHCGPSAVHCRDTRVCQNGMTSSTLGTNKQHILLAARRLRVGPEFVVLRTGNWRLTLSNVPFITGYKTTFALATRGAKIA